MSTPDAILLSRIKEGNQHAVNEALQKHYRELLLHAFSLLANPDDAKDAVQQSLANILLHNKLRTISSTLKGYLHIAVHNQCLQILHSRQRSRQQALLWQKANTEIDYPNLDMEDLACHNAQLLKQEMRSLPLQQRTSLTLVHGHGHAYADAASHMGISVNSLKTHLRLAIAAIRKRMM